MIVIDNKSTLVTDADVAKMTKAVQSQVHRHLAPLWHIQPSNITFGSKSVSPGDWVITIMDDSDQAGALGYHSEDNGVVYGRVFAKPTLDNGGTIMSGAFSVSVTLSHEVLETVVDYNANRWVDDNNSSLYALEVGDPVESSFYDISVFGRPVSVSNFVLPAWFDPQATAGPYDYLGHLHAPLTLDKNGYCIKMQAGKVSQVFGEEYPEWKLASKASELSRSSRRN